MTTSTVDEDRHLPDGLGEGCSLEVVTRDAARLSQAISDAEGNGVDVFEGSTQLDADLVEVGCRADAAWQILWNNPKIHDAERRKVWLACDEHRGWLENFLQQRLFWRSTEPLEDAET